MKQCEKCHTENSGEAAYCKNCGHVLEAGKTHEVVFYSPTISAINLRLQWSLSIFVISLPFGFLVLISDIFGLSHSFVIGIMPHILKIFLFFSNIISFILVIVYLFKYPIKQWRKFYINKRLSDAKELLTSFAFSNNKSEESIKIGENAKGELHLKDKSLGAKGYFHLVTDKEGNVLLIGEKYNTQSLIRMVFGKDINFIEK